METDLKMLKIFFDNHFLKINSSKTKYILFSGKISLEYFTSQSLNITHENEMIERVQSSLGLIIDQELKFKNLIELVKSKIFQ